MDRNRLIEELIRDEGMRNRAYKDSVGLWTIGVGHLIGSDTQADMPRMSLITENEARALLAMDIEFANGLARDLIPELDALSDARQRALTNMAFNLGSRLAGFKHFLAAVKEENWDVAAREMMDSMWAKQVGARAERLRDMIFDGF